MTTMRDIESTGTWEDVVEIPESVERTLEAAVGFDELVDVLSAPTVRRIIVTGNGASYYLAQALWLLSLSYQMDGREVMAVPAGVLASHNLTLRDGDLVLGISASGELRDLVEWIKPKDPVVPFAAISCNPEGTIGQRAIACAVPQLVSQRSATHTQAFAAGWSTLLMIWARTRGDGPLEKLARRSPEVAADAVESAADVVDTLSALPTPTAVYALGTGIGWATAGQVSLLVKELASLPCEGVETREAATVAMTVVREDHLIMSVAHPEDHLAHEAEEACRSRGAQILRLNHYSGEADPMLALAAIAAVPPAAAVGLAFGLRSKTPAEIDHPSWMKTYEMVARTRRYG